jgi:hypothetical protein
MVAGASRGLTGTQPGRFFGWVIGGGLPSAMAADRLTTAWDQNAGIHAASPAASVAEEVAGGWPKELLGLPPEASFAFVTGAQMAHVTCLAAARHAVLERRGWDVERQGLRGAPRVRVLASARGAASRGREGSPRGNKRGWPASRQTSPASRPDRRRSGHAPPPPGSTPLADRAGRAQVASRRRSAIGAGGPAKAPSKRRHDDGGRRR